MVSFFAFEKKKKKILYIMMILCMLLIANIDSSFQNYVINFQDSLCINSWDDSRFSQMKILRILILRQMTRCIRVAMIDDLFFLEEEMSPAFPPHTHTHAHTYICGEVRHVWD